MEKKPLHVNGIITTAKMFLTGIYFLELLSIRTETWLIVKCFFVCLPCIVCLLQFHRFTEPLWVIPAENAPKYAGITRAKYTIVLPTIVYFIRVVFIRATKSKTSIYKCAEIK